jgi:hypothetical protein
VRSQVMGKLIRTSVELSVRQTQIAESDRKIVWRSLNLFFEKLMNTLISWILGSGIVELK